jgi:hypothetical protein
MSSRVAPLADVIGPVPFRMALAGGWIDQPFVSQRNPAPPGSMVVVNLEPTVRYMDRSGMATGTRKVALSLWPTGVPNREPADLVRELYAAENRGKREPSGSQDMIGLLYPGINRLDYDAEFEGGVFPRHIESCCDQRPARWLERVIHMVPVAPRPEGYNPLGIKNLEPHWIRKLGQSGKDCYDAILARDVAALGASMNACMRCWATLLPRTVRHPTLTVDLVALLEHYQARYPGAMYSGCGGGYLFVASEKPVPGAFAVQVRTGVRPV